MRSLKSTLVLALSALALTTAAWADNIGYVNYDKVIASYDKAQDVSNDIKVREADLRKMQADFAKQLKDSRQDNPKSPVANDTLEKELREKLQAKFNEYRDWTLTQNKAINQEVDTAISQAAKSHQIDVVLSDRMVLLGGKDLTAEVITALNKPIAQ